MQHADKQLALPLADSETGRIPEYSIRISKRAKHLQIKVTPWHGVEVIAARRHTKKAIREFVVKNRAWVLDTWEKLKQSYPEAGAAVLPRELNLLALETCLAVRYETGGQLKVHQSKASELVVTSPSKDIILISGGLKKWLMRHARECLAPRLRNVSQRIGLDFKKTHIRAQKTRWGSCSSNGVISLNYKLLFLPEDLVNYLMVHELCHTRYMDHSPKYWRLVKQFEPAYRDFEKRLDNAWRYVPMWAHTC
ncbi:MAG: M48 family metallopeptidase [Gammaproteobacteria bacterium]|nr:M48 family metallopeptidase [Gammaproteobacteria bacterium]